VSDDKNISPEDEKMHQLLNKCKAFEGNASEIAEKAIECSQEFDWDIDEEKTNERLVRYYVAEGIIERPQREGREAYYNFRHLVQLLNARRMLAAGISLSVIGKYNRSSTTVALEEGLHKTLPKEAEILINTLMHEELGGKSSAQTDASKRPSNSANAIPSTHRLGFPDLVEEINQLKSDWMHELEFVKRLRSEFNNLQKGMLQQNDQVEDLTRFLKNSLMRATEENLKIQDWIKAQFEKILDQQHVTQEIFSKLSFEQERSIEKNIQAIDRLVLNQEVIQKELNTMLNRLYQQHEDLISRVDATEAKYLKKPSNNN
jgi:hypothetical protein